MREHEDNPMTNLLVKNFSGLLGWCVVALGLAMTPGCDAAVGGSCDDGDVACKDANTKLFCKGGKYTAMLCKGEEGCKIADGMLRCDVGANATGDVCDKANQDQGDCAPDGKSLVVCLDEKLAVLSCDGPDGCKDAGDSFLCDSSTSTVGDACQTDAAACTADKIQMLGCKDGKWAVDHLCRGKKGCRKDGTKIRCDQSLGTLGDPCTPGSACSVDGTQMLACKDGKLATEHPCRGKKGCRQEGAQIRCDRSIGSLDDPCTEGAACSDDGKAMLECKDGKLVVDRKCPVKGCRIEGQKALCR